MSVYDALVGLISSNDRSFSILYSRGQAMNNVAWVMVCGIVHLALGGLCVQK